MLVIARSQQAEKATSQVVVEAGHTLMEVAVVESAAGNLAVTVTVLLVEHLE
jgi:hypothetical protein